MSDDESRRPAPWPYFEKVTQNTADGERDAVQGHADGDPSDQQFDLPVRRVWPFGLRSRPPVGVWAAVVPCGSIANSLMVGAESKKFGPSDLKDGELAIYNKVTGCVIKLDENGKVSISSATGQVAELNGDTFAMVQWDDGTTGGFVHAFNTFAKVVATQPTVVSPVNAIASLNAIITAASTLAATIATASNFSSIKAKNG